jgi:hypothetical protein
MKRSPQNYARSLGKVFGIKEVKLSEQLRTLHSEGPRDVYRSPSIVTVMKFGRLRCVGLVGKMEDRKGMKTEFWWETSLKAITWNKGEGTGG